MPAAVASGLWMPFEVLPTILQRIGPMLPTYHPAQLGLAQIDGSAAGTHVLALVLWTTGAALLAAVAYRRSRP
jgi:ABC-2 type transport system permease protein